MIFEIASWVMMGVGGFVILRVIGICLVDKYLAYTDKTRYVKRIKRRTGPPVDFADGGIVKTDGSRLVGEVMNDQDTPEKK